MHMFSYCGLGLVFSVFSESSTYPQVEVAKSPTISLTPLVI